MVSVARAVRWRAWVGSLLPIAIGAGLGGCKPDFPDRQSAIVGPRILAVRSEPAEADPGKDVAYRALVVTPAGTVDDAAIEFDFCTLPKPIVELNDVATACFYPPGPSADFLVPLGVGPDARGTLPKNGCRQFGSDVPEPKPGEPAGRPTDPDSTGGYYQPVRLVLGPLQALGETRLSCGLPGATREALVDFRQRYHANENPTLGSVTTLRDGQPLAVEGSSTPTLVGRGEALHLRAAWAPCPTVASCGDGICSGVEDVKACPDDCTAPMGCTGAEEYVAYDLATRAVVERRESMRVSWFASDGAFADDRTGRDESDPTASADGAWTAPGSPSTVHLWVVLRDARGGVGWGAFVVEVR